MSQNGKSGLKFTNRAGSMSWPNKDEREKFEITGFIRAYHSLHPSVELDVVSKGERPDFVVKDKNSSEEFGVELTSVYLNDRCVPDEHKPPIPDRLRTIGIPHDPVEVEEYKKRLVAAIQEKIQKAKRGYDLRRKLLLSIHVNEYRAIFIDTQEEWEKLVADHEGLFDGMYPFIEIVFWNLANGGVFSVKPGSHI